MCFSAAASFTAAGALTPMGLVAVSMARRRDARRWWPLAITPLLFAAQQSLEGLVWLGMGNPTSVLPAQLISVAYLGFAFALWPIWMPWAALGLTDNRSAPWQRRLVQGLLGLGAVLALLLWLPLLFHPQLINPVVQHGSINYQVQTPIAAQVSHQLVALIYALIVCVPLLLTPIRRLRWFAGGLVLAFAVAQLAFLYAFSSVWCYFSAVLSLLVLWVLQEDPLPG